MTYRDKSNLSDDQKKWSEWSMRPKKASRKPTDYASLFVLVMSALVASGFHQNLGI